MNDNYFYWNIFKDLGSVDAYLEYKNNNTVATEKELCNENY